MTLPALYELAAEYRAVAERLADMDLDAQTIADTLESISGDLETKSANVAYVAMNFEALAAAIKKREGDLKDRREAAEKAAERARDYIKRCMELAGVEKVETPDVCLSFRKSQAVVIDGEDLIPQQYMRQKPQPAPEPDKTAIAAAIKAGATVPGAHVEVRRNLQIK